MMPVKTVWVFLIAHSGVLSQLAGWIRDWLHLTNQAFHAGYSVHAALLPTLCVLVLWTQGGPVEHEGFEAK